MSGGNSFSFPIWTSAQAVELKICPCSQLSREENETWQGQEGWRSGGGVAAAVVMAGQ